MTKILLKNQKVGGYFFIRLLDMPKISNNFNSDALLVFYIVSYFKFPFSPLFGIKSFIQLQS